MTHFETMRLVDSLSHKDLLESTQGILDGLDLRCPDCRKLRDVITPILEAVIAEKEK